MRHITHITGGIALAAALPLLVAVPGAAAAQPSASGSAAARWHEVASYCSASGDTCYGIQRWGDQIRLRLDTFVDFGSAEFCVRKARQSTGICRTRDLQPSRNSLYTAKIRWNTNYPSAGGQKRVVSFAGYPKTLSFRP